MKKYGQCENGKKRERKKTGNEEAKVWTGGGWRSWPQTKEWGLAGVPPCSRAAGGYQSPEAPRGPFKDLRGRTLGHLPADAALEKA